MSEWNHTVCMLYVGDPTVANKIAKAFDPDEGGERTFTLNASPSGQAPATYCVVSIPAKDVFLGYLNQLTNGDALKGYVAYNYVNRWPALSVPTLEDCVEFLIGVTWEVDIELEDFLAKHSLKFITDDVPAL